MPLARVGPELRQRRIDLAVQRHRGRGAEVVEHGRRLVEEQRQVVLDAGRRRCRCRCPCRARTLVGSPSIRSRQRRAKGGARRLVHREFAARQQAHLGHRVERALRVGVEGADRIDLVAEQVDAVGHRRAHREQVDQAAAHRVFARRDDLAHVRVAGQRQLRLQPRLVEPLALLEVEGVGRRGRRAARAAPAPSSPAAAPRRPRPGGCATASPAARRSGPGAARRCRRAASPSRGRRRCAGPARRRRARPRGAACPPARR